MRYDLRARLASNRARVSRQHERAALHEKPVLPNFNPRPCAAFHSVERIGGGASDPLAIQPLMELELRGKERVCCAQQEEADDTQT